MINVFTAGANIPITATASVSSGSIQSVAFYSVSSVSGSQQVTGTATSSPYTVTWNGVAAGSYTLTAKATSAAGVAKTSAGVVLTVNPVPSPSPSPSPSPTGSFSSAMTIISNKCVLCHNGTGGRDFRAYLTSESGWISSGMVIAGSATNSSLYKYLQGTGLSPGTMPKGLTALSSSELSTIQTWINQMPGPSPTPTPTNRFGAAMQVITNNCVSCHKAGGPAPRDFTALMTSETSWQSAGLVVAGNSTGSQLYQALQGTGLSPGDMPYGGSALSSDLSTIKGWIDLMSTSPLVMATPGPTYNPAFACGSSPALIASTIKRLAKMNYVGSLTEFLSKMTSADRAAVIAGVQAQINLIPIDGSSTDPVNPDVNLFTVSDYRVTQQHADNLFNIAYALATAIAGSTTYTNELMQVCGAGSTRSSLSTSTCLQKFISYFGQKSFRRPLISPKRPISPRSTIMWWHLAPMAWPGSSDGCSRTRAFSTNSTTKDRRLPEPLAPALPPPAPAPSR